MILLPAILALSKVLGHSTLDFLEARGNHLANVSTGLLPFKEPSVARSLSWSEGLCPQMITLEKLARKAQLLVSEKEK